MKLFRRVTPGVNPDIEIHEALTRAGCRARRAAPRLDRRGLDDDADGELIRHLGMLQEFLRTATDGWDLARASVRDLLVEEDLHPDEVGGDFAGRGRTAGRAPAPVTPTWPSSSRPSTRTPPSWPSSPPR